jgi:tetratricopeptide (TPR) repeat protein
MLRLIGFFVLAIVLANLLGHVPVIGGLFRHTGLIGIWITAIGLSLLFSHLGARALRIGRDRAELRRLEAVDSAYNHGKIGTLYLSQGRARKALSHLEQAVEGEPDSQEWLYRLGCAHIALGRHAEAVEPLRSCLDQDEEFAYGSAMMRLAEARAGSGEHEAALAVLEVQERNHGPSPESAYRRGASLKALGRKEEARAAFGEVFALARDSVRYQRREAGTWALRARFASLF